MATPKFGFSLAPIAKEDYPEIAKLIYEMNILQPINRFHFNEWWNKNVQIAGNLQSIEDDQGAHPNSESLKVVDSETGEIIGFFVTERQKSKTQEEKEKVQAKQDEKKQSPPPELNQEFRNFMLEAIKDQIKEMDDVEHLILRLITVKDKFRKHGIGKELMKICIDKAKKAQIPLYLLAVPTARDFYVKMGMREISHSDVDLGKFAGPNRGYGIWRLYGMILD